MIVLLFLIVTAVTGRNATAHVEENEPFASAAESAQRRTSGKGKSCMEHILVLFQTISVFKSSSSSFVLPCKALQQLAKAESRQHMVKRMERQERAMSKPEQPSPKQKYSHFRNCAPPLDEKGGIIMEKVFPVFSERVFRACFGLVI